jgi:hypothetical protein
MNPGSLVSATIALPVGQEGFCTRNVRVPAGWPSSDTSTV